VGDIVTTYVTTPIYYPNDVPHIGTAYPTLAADIYARWSRLRGQETFFLTGTDEHGKKIENVARRRGVTPQELVDELSEEFKATFKQLNISHDRFIRTTDEDHVRVVRHILTRVHERGDIYKGTYEGLYCVECEAYYTPDDLRDGQCPLHLKPVEVLKEDCYYFRLSNYREWLLGYYEAHPDFIMPESRRREVVSFVEGGLEDLCISRSTFKWGIPVPFDEGHITYVWFDALINYVTGVGILDEPERFETFWPSATHIIGKDILRFHAVIWPAMLESAGLPPPRRIFAHGFWMVNGRKFSKSLGNAILPGYLVERYGLDPLRYYMFRETPFGADGDFSEANLVGRNNSELAQGLGNLLQRITTMIVKYHDGIIPAPAEVGESETAVAEAAGDAVRAVAESIEGLALKEALDVIWEFISRLNAYVNAREPWALAKRGETAALNTVLAHLAEGLRFLSVLVAPFMPDSAQAIAERLGLGDVPAAYALQWGESLTGRHVKQGPPLFRMLEPPVEEAPAPVTHAADPAVLALGVNYCVAQINGLKVKREAAPLEQRKREVEARIRARGRGWADAYPEARGFQEIYERLGKAPGEVPSPADSLSEYIFNSGLGRLPQINVVVDLYNLYSLTHFLSIGAHDREKIRGTIRLDFAREVIPYHPLGSQTQSHIRPGEYYWHDDEHVLCRLDVKQGEATKVDELTRHVVLIVLGNAAISSQNVRRLTEQLCEEIVGLCGGEYTIIG
jgi:methionyl-tRNA synthetase